MLLSKIKYWIIMFFASKAGVTKINDKIMNNSGKSIYNVSVKNYKGDQIDWANYKGKKILLVNVASKCGFTPQYDELQKLNEKFKDKLEIIGLPCNDFGGQEPGRSEEVATFCKLNYGVSFLISEKVIIKGDKKSEIYTWLTNETLNGWNNEEPSWNFGKYLLNENGELINFFGSSVSPLSKDVENSIVNK